MKVKLLTDTAKAPERQSEGAGGYDIFADNSEVIHVVTGTPKAINTGVAVQIPKGYVGFIKPRSGLAFKKGIDHMAGVIDSDYTGEIKLLLTSNSSYGELRVEQGDRVAQLVVLPCYTDDIELVDDLEDTERGNNGFGSSGVK